MMKKILIATACLLLILGKMPDAAAQSTFTADLELIFRDTVRNFVIEPDDSVDIGFAVVNHGPDDIDTSSFVLFSMTGIPPSFFLIVQSDDGDLMLIPNGDTVLSRGVRFSNPDAAVNDTTFDYCFFLRVNEDPDSFIYDPNQLNDTICFSVTFKGTGPLSIAARNREASTLSISPNPATGKAGIDLPAGGGNEGILRVYSIDGRLWQELAVKRQDTRLEWDVQHWPKGAYIVDYRNEKQRRTGKLLVQ